MKYFFHFFYHANDMRFVLGDKVAGVATKSMTEYDEVMHMISCMSRYVQYLHCTLFSMHELHKIQHVYAHTNTHA